MDTYCTVIWVLVLLSFASGSVVAAGKEQIRVRLVAGSNSTEGRVEVLYAGAWGTVCGDGWTERNSHVICRMLGYGKALTTQEFGQGTGPIWLDNVACTGRESSIFACHHQGWAIHNCKHSQDIGVVCGKGSPNIAVLLGGGPFANIGRVDIRYYGIWKSVCDNGWDLKGANVICTMRGNSKAVVALKGYSGSSARVWLSNVRCDGSESSIASCASSGWGRNTCENSNNAGALCVPRGSDKEFLVYLRDGNVHHAGRVEVEYYGMQGTLRYGKLRLQDANVICRNLGYTSAVTVYKHGGGTCSFWIESMQCRGNENSTKLCQNIQWRADSNYNHRNDAGVICQRSSGEGANVSVRLVVRTVQVRYHGLWGRVSTSGWDLKDAYVICRMLNFTKASTIGQVYGIGAGPILLRDLECSGNEDSLERCRHSEWGTARHNIEYDPPGATAMCDNLSGDELNVSVRLAGNAKHAGRVEVRYKTTWAGVCDDNWDILDAHVVCKMLGYQTAVAAIHRLDGGPGGTWMRDVACSGKETSIALCYHQGWGRRYCSRTRHAGVMCQASYDPPSVQVRLVAGFSTNSGRVEIGFRGAWGTLCDSIWNINNGHVICRMLGYAGVRVEFPKSPFGPGDGIIWLSNLRCTGTEDSIDQCNHDEWGIHNCNHDNDAAVMCRKAEAPQFYVNESESIKSTTIVLHFMTTPKRDEMISAYQITVEKTSNEQHFISMKQTHVSLGQDLNNVKIAKENGEHVYVTAEVLGPNLVDNFTVGDDEYYNGYYNEPLDPGCNYRVYVRAVIIGQNGTDMYERKIGVWHSEILTIALLSSTVIVILLLSAYLIRLRKKRKHMARKKAKEETNDRYSQSVTHMDVEMTERLPSVDVIGYASLSRATRTAEHVRGASHQINWSGTRTGVVPEPKMYEYLSEFEMGYSQSPEIQMTKGMAAMLVYLTKEANEESIVKGESNESKS